MKSAFTVTVAAPHWMEGGKQGADFSAPSVLQMFAERSQQKCVVLLQVL